MQDRVACLTIHEGKSIMNKQEVKQKVNELKELLQNNPDWGKERKRSLEDYIKVLKNRL